MMFSDSGFQPHGIEVRAERSNFTRAISLVFASHENGRVGIAKQMVFEDYDQDSGEIIPRTVELRMHAAQQLMDELWRCGLRPTEGTGSAGALAATERHLKDMQHIAMGVLKLGSDK